MTLIADRYRLAESIGTGGMSNVYAAEDTLLGRGVAIKMLKIEMARDQAFRERFRREAQNSARLSHASIVAVFDTGETEVDGVSVPFIVMERVHGRTVRDIVREDGPLPPEQAAALLVPVCDALQASHDSGIIHRDVKPANIMVTPIGAVKVMDFGIARALDDSTSAMTQTSAVIGTAQYLSPEQARGKQADARSDVYALGCVLYEAVTGEAPFEGETPFAVAYQHVQEDPQPPSERIIGDSLTPTEAVNLDAVTLTAMAKHPADRYQSATEMGEDLDRLARGSVTRAARSHVESGQIEDSAAYAAPTPTEHFPATQAPPAHVASPVAVPPSGYGAYQPVEASQSHASRRSRSSGSVAKTLAAILALLLIAAGGLFAWEFFKDEGTSGGEKNSQVESIKVPHVARKPRVEVLTKLRDLGFTVEEEERPSPDIDRGLAIGTEPAAGSSLRPGSTVRVLISSGQELTDVPDLRNMRPSDAAAALEKAGLRLSSRVEETHSAVIPEGSVENQNPPAGSRVAKGTEIAITVSSGPETARVPSLNGLSSAEAQATLSSLGFVPAPEFVDGVEPKGSVLAVGGAGTEAPRGSEVVLQISNGELFVMPDITRMNASQAVQTLTSAGWKGSQSKLEYGPVVPTGSLVDDRLIAFQGQQAGQKVRKDAKIQIREWRFDLAALAGVTRN